MDSIKHEHSISWFFQPVIQQDDDDEDYTPLRLPGEFIPASMRETQGLHRLEKYLNLEGFLEKSLKIKSALKGSGKSLKSLENFRNSTFFVVLSNVDRDLNQYKIVVPIFCAA